MIEFAKGCDYAMNMVDEVLDTVTKGEHSKTVNYIEERKEIERAEKKVKQEEEIFKAQVEEEWNQFANVAVTAGADLDPDQAEAISSNSVITECFDLGNIKSLADIGIDVDFLKELDTPSKNRSVIFSHMQCFLSCLCSYL